MALNKKTFIEKLPNRLKSVFFDLVAEWENDGNELSDDYIEVDINKIKQNSFKKVCAMCEIFGIDIEPVMERAAIMHYDGGASIQSADRYAIINRFNEMYPEYGNRLALWLFDNSITIKSCMERENCSVCDAVEGIVSKRKTLC